MRSRVKTDKGNAVVIWGIFILIMILVCAVLIVDLAKAMYVKNVYSSYARKGSTKQQFKGTRLCRVDLSLNQLRK